MKTKNLIHVVSPEAEEIDTVEGAAFSSIEAALEYVRTARRESVDECSFHIKLPPGRYDMSDSLNLGRDDSGTQNCPLIIEGDKQEETIISGGKRLQGCRTVTDPKVLLRLPEESRERVWEFDLMDNGVSAEWGKLSPRFGCGKAAVPGNQPWPEVYYNDIPLNLTRWPLETDAHVGQVYASEHTTNGVRYETPGEFSVAEDIDLSGWQTAFDSGDVWTSGMWCWLWNCSILPVKTVDMRKGIITHGLPAPYGIRKGKPFYFLNLLEELRKPGQYYVDRQHAKLYLIPPEGACAPERARIDISVATNPFIQCKDAYHVTFRHLTFEYHQRDVITVDGGVGVAVENCEIRNVSGTGVVMRGGAEYRILHSHLHTLGAAGIKVDSGDRRTLSAGECLIENCRIHDFCRINQAYAPAIWVSGCGNTIRHCEIYNSPHHGIRLEGDNHLVELSAFHHLVLEFDDQSAIDMMGNPYYRGNVFRWNSFCEIGGGQTQEGQAGIRLDDFISGVDIIGNIFYRVGSGTMGGVQLHGGKDNHVVNNLFISCAAMVSFSPWGEERWLKSLKSWRFGDNALELSEARLKAYPDLLEVESNFDRNFVTGNISLGCHTPTLDDGGQNICTGNLIRTEVPDWPTGGNGLPVVDFSDPLFTEMDFKPVPLKEVGCYPAEGRLLYE